MKTMQAIRWGAMLALLTLISGTSMANEFPFYDGKWAQERSDIQTSPTEFYGRLANGFRYVIKPHQKPKERVTMYLDVQAGSLMEEPHELGAAHYLEHMAFNGSEHFKPGELVPFFQREGMSFGGDTNAHTNQVETVYKLNLSGVDPERLDKGLLILSDYASKLSLFEKEVNSERGIILSEKRARNSEMLQNFYKLQAFLYPNSRFSNPVIGHENTISAIKASDLEHFYQKWYIPERMVLVVVGDVKPEDMAARIEKYFGTMKSTGKLPQVSDFGDTFKPGIEALTLKIPEANAILVWYGLFPRDEQNYTHALEKQLLVAQVGDLIVQRRLEQYRETHPDLWQDVQFENESVEGRRPKVKFAVTTSPDKLASVMGMMKGQMALWKKDGFTAQELAWAKSVLKQSFMNVGQYQETLTNVQYTQALVEAINGNRVYTPPLVASERLAALLPSITLQEVNASLKRALSSSVERLVYMAQSPMTHEALLSLWEDTPATMVNAPSVTQGQVFPYLPKPPETELPAVKTEPLAYKKSGLEVTRLTLANGVHVVLLPTDLDKRMVSVKLYFGDGLKSIADEDSDLLKVAQALANRSGVGRLSVLETEDALHQYGVEVKETIGARRSAIVGHTTTDELPRLLEAVRTQFMDPHWASVARPELELDIQLADEGRGKTFDRVLSEKRMAWFKGDRHVDAPLTMKGLTRVSNEAALDALVAQRQHGDKTLFVVGDFNEKEVLPEVVNLFSSLNAESEPRRKVGLSSHVPLGKTHREVVSADHLGKINVAMMWTYRVEGEPLQQNQTVTTLEMLTLLMKEALRQTVREDMGISYSPRARMATQHRHGGIEVRIMLDVSGHMKDEATLEKAMHKVAQKMQSTLVSEDELQRLVKIELGRSEVAPRQLGPIVTALTADVLDGHHDLESLEHWDTDLKAITPAVIQDWAKKVLHAKPATFILVSGSDKEAPSSKP